jgi:hypothetical protein
MNNDILTNDHDVGNLVAKLSEQIIESFANNLFIHVSQ